MVWDVVIIGNGPAGLSAALYLLRANFTAALVGKDNGALEKAERIENYFGIPEPVSGRELIATGKKQVEQLGGTFIQDEVVGISWDRNFGVITSQGTLEAKAIIITTGSKRLTAKIENLSALEGRGVSYCAVCDAFFYRGKEVAVLGSGEYALHEAGALLDVASHVTILTNGEIPCVSFPDKATVITTPIEKLNGEEVLESVTFKDGSVLSVAGLFVALGSAGGSDLAKKLGIALENNKIVVDKNMSTALPGVFAAGDCIGGVQQIATAVGEGATAALSAIKFLRTE